MIATKQLQSFFYFLNPEVYVYNFDQNHNKIQLKATGGSGEGDIVYSGDNVINGHLIFYEPGTYHVRATKYGFSV